MRLFFGFAAGLLTWTTSVASGSTLQLRQDSNNTVYKLGETPLKTRWTDQVGTNPWPEFPRPRLQRSAWKNLNGVWRYRDTDNTTLSNPPFGQRLEAPVLVPACLESALSGSPRIIFLGNTLLIEG